MMDGFAALDMRETTVAVGDRKIKVSTGGRGEPLLMLHGGGPGATGMSNFRRNVDVLGAHFHLIIPDMPGYGGSSKGISRKDPFGDIAGSMRGLLDVLGFKQADVMGNSLGGAVALRLGLEAPDRVRRIVLMGPGGMGVGRTLPTKGLMKLLTYYAGGGPSRVKLKEFINYLVFDPSQISDALIDERYRASIAPDVLKDPPLVKPRGFPPRTMDLLRDDRLDRLTNRVLIMWGSDDRVNPASGGLKLLKRLPNAELYLINKVGHWIQWERPDEFNDLVTGFLKRP